MYALKKTEKNNHESGTNEKEERVELTQESNAKKSRMTLCAESNLSKLKLEIISRKLQREYWEEYPGYQEISSD